MLSVWGSLGRPQALLGGAPAPAPAAAAAPGPSPAPPLDASSQATAGSPAGARAQHSHTHTHKTVTHAHTHTQPHRLQPLPLERFGSLLHLGLLPPTVSFLRVERGIPPLCQHHHPPPRTPRIRLLLTPKREHRGARASLPRDGVLRREVMLVPHPWQEPEGAWQGP